jgi:hypothetical protein
VAAVVAADAVVRAGNLSIRSIQFDHFPMQPYRAVRLLIQEQLWLGARNNRSKNGKKSNSGKRSSK